MPSDVTTAPVLLVGAGAMARAYATVLVAIEQPVVVVGRGATSADAFADAIGVRPEVGGLDRWLASGPTLPERAIVAVNVDQLHASTLALLDAGVREILVEKPAGLTVAQLDELTATAARTGAQVFVAYNRRFLASTLAARRLVEEDGGVASFTFDFTEIADRVGATGHPDEVKRSWLLANSTHVIDLAFSLGGQPAQLEPQRGGQLDWHPTGARFAGAGRSTDGALFAYLADWEAPGRWGVELRTRARRIELRPLEQLHVQRHGSFELEDVPLDDDLDRRFKPGLHRQVRAFLDPTDAHRGLLPDITAHRDFVRDVVVPIATAGASSAG